MERSLSSKPTQRKRIWAALAMLGAEMLLSGCMAFAPVIEEPLRVGNVADLSARDLDLRPGVTSLSEAHARLSQRGMTGIVEDTFAQATGPRTSVLGADYQSQVQVFEDERYVTSLTLPTEGLPPYGMALRLGISDGRPILLVLYRDPLDRASVPPVLLTFQRGERGFDPISRTTFEAISQERGGMTQPMLLGDNLGEGIMLVARDKSGALWDVSYLLTSEGPLIRAKPQSTLDAMRCSCVQRYAMGFTKNGDNH